MDGNQEHVSLLDENPISASCKSISVKNPGSSGGNFLSEENPSFSGNPLPENKPLFEKHPFSSKSPIAGKSPIADKSPIAVGTIAVESSIAGGTIEVESSNDLETSIEVGTIADKSPIAVGTIAVESSIAVGTIEVESSNAIESPIAVKTSIEVGTIEVESSNAIESPIAVKTSIEVGTIEVESSNAVESPNAVKTPIEVGTIEVESSIAVENTITPERGRGRPAKNLFPCTFDESATPKRGRPPKNKFKSINTNIIEKVPTEIDNLKVQVLKLNDQLQVKDNLIKQLQDKDDHLIKQLQDKDDNLIKQLQDKDNLIKQLKKDFDNSIEENLNLNAKLDSLKINNAFLKKSHKLLELNIVELKQKNKKEPQETKGTQVNFEVPTKRIISVTNVRKVPREAENLKHNALKHRAMEVNKFITETQGINPTIRNGVIKELVRNYCYSNIHLNAEEVAEMQVKVNLTYSQIKKLTTFFNSKEKWVCLRNEKDVRSVKNKLSNNLFNIEDWDIGEKLLEMNDGSQKYFGYAIVKSFKDYFFKILNTYLDNNKLFFPSEWPQNEILVAIYGDHGRGTVGPSSDGTYKEAFVITNTIFNECANMDKFHIHGIFAGKDNYQNLYSFLGPIHEELSSLNDSDYEYNNLTYKIKIILIFDLARLSTEFGHQGHSSTFPSLIDNVNINHLRKHPQYPHLPENCKDINKRDPESFFKNYNNNNILSGAKNLKLLGKHNGSVSDFPLIKISNINQIMLPFLHLQMGVTQVVFTQMKEELAKNNNNEKDTSSYEIMDNLEKQITNFEGESLSLSKQIAIISRISQSFNLSSNELMKLIINHYPKLKLKDNIKKVCKYCHNIFKNCKCKCSSPSCFIRWPDFLNHDIDMVNCSKCKNGIHTYCDPNYLLKFTNEYICLVCNKESNEQIIHNYKMVLTELQKNQKSLITNLTNTKGDLSKQKNEYIHKKCDSITKLNNILSSIKVEPQAYHGGDFNGKDIWKIIKNHNIFYKEFPTIETKFKPIFITLERISRIVSKSNMLSAEEIDEFERNCNNLGTLFFKNFPDRAITPKLHELIFNLPQLVKEYKCYRPFFAIEQQGESIHRSFAEKLHKNCFITGKGKKIFFSLKEMSLKSNFK